MNTLPLKLFMLGFLISTSIITSAQVGSIDQNLDRLLLSHPTSQSIDLFSGMEPDAIAHNRGLEVFEYASYLKIDAQMLNDIQHSRAARINFNLPFSEGRTLALDLVRVDLFSQGEKFIYSSGRTHSKEQVVTYWGKVRGTSSSLVSFTVAKGQAHANISFHNQNYELSQLDESEHYVLFNTSEAEQNEEFICSTDESDLKPIVMQDQSTYRSGADSSHVVEIYFEIDHELYNKFEEKTPSFVLGVISQVFLMYFIDDMDLQITEIKIWDTPDPYSGPTSYNMLEQFRTAIGANFTGHLAHLMGLTGGGGIAKLDALCTKSTAQGYSRVIPYFKKIPLYSWSVFVVTHELGHNMGSPHTHACAWNGDNTQIDDCKHVAYNSPSSDCYDQDNPILPVEGGTIMSYCHLTPLIGINFETGFGSQPGDLMRDRINNSGCVNSIQKDSLDVAIAGFKHEGPYVGVDSVSIQMELINFGQDTVESVEITLTMNDTFYSKKTYACQIPFGKYKFLTLDSIWVIGMGKHDLKAEVTKVNNANDQRSFNNTFTHEFERITGLKYELTLILDRKPEETNWIVQSIQGDTMVLGINHYGHDHYHDTMTAYFWLPEGVYYLRVFDYGDDGMCCSHGIGGYYFKRTDTDLIFKKGGEFESIDTLLFYTEIRDCDLEVNNIQSSGPNSMDSVLKCATDGDIITLDSTLTGMVIPITNTIHVDRIVAVRPEITNQWTYIAQDTSMVHQGIPAIEYTRKLELNNLRSLEKLIFHQIDDGELFMDKVRLDLGFEIK